MHGLRILALLAATAIVPAAHAQTAAPETEAPAEIVETAPIEAPPVEEGTGDDLVSIVGDTPYVTVQPEGFLFSSDLVGADVYGLEDEKIGDINDLLIDGEGQVAAVVIGVGGFLGLGEKDVAVPLETLDVAVEDDALVLHLAATEAELLEAPVFARADGTTTDRLGQFERAYEGARRDAEAALEVAGERAGQIYEEAAREAEVLAREAQSEASRFIERSREALRVLRGEPEEEPVEPAPAQ